MRFFRTPSVLPLLYPSLLWRVNTVNKDLYLTFDDGPVAGPTDFVLDTLKSFNAVATFFFIGDNIRKHPNEFRKVVDCGHSVGNHTFNHLNGWRTPNEEYVNNTQLCQQQIAHPTTLFRPPFGRIKRSQMSKLAQYNIVMWDVLTFDYDRSLDSEKCLSGSISAVRPGSIIVFHDSIKAEKNLTYVLPRFIDQCLSKGYTFKKL